MLALVTSALGQEAGVVGTPFPGAPFASNQANTAGGIEVQASTQYGPIVGRYARMDRVVRFYGVPVGNTTAGENRFKAPIPPEPWTTPKQTYVSLSCLQSNAGGETLIGTEDCMIVDVVAPLNKTTGTFPAMPGTFPVSFWIYGGGFTMESFPFYQAKDNMYATGDSKLFSYLSTEGSSVQVFGKYRVQYLGFLSHPALRNGIGGNQYSGNWGMFDILNCLRWVQTNIGNFGGDSSAVTIHGESAGATLTGVVCVSPLSYSGEYAVNGPLFRACIGQSMWQVGGLGATYSQVMRDEAGAGMVQAVGCSPDGYSVTTDQITDIAVLTEIAECLRAMNSSTSMETPMTPIHKMLTGLTTANATAFDAVHGGGSIEYLEYQTLGYYPTIDGYALPVAPIDCIKAGYSAKTHILLMQNADEESLYIAPGWDPVTYYVYEYYNYGFFYSIYSQPAGGGGDAGISTLLNTTFGMPWPAGTAGSAVTPYYQSQGITNYFQAQTAAMTDGYFAVNHNLLQEAFKGQSGRTDGTIYRAIFAEPNRDAMDGPEPGLFGVPHTADITYTWGYYQQGKNAVNENVAGPFTTYFEYSKEQTTMGDTMHVYWTNFFASGHPTPPTTRRRLSDHSELPTWDPCTIGDNNTMVFQSTVPSGAMLNPCVMFTACLAENTKNWRKSATEFWMSGYASTPDFDTCDNVQVGLSHTATFGTQYLDGCTIPQYSPSPPPATGAPVATPVAAPTTGSCASWCNVWTCGMSVCTGCSDCASLTAGTYCSSWCNAYTTSFTHCAGC